VLQTALSKLTRWCMTCHDSRVCRRHAPHRGKCAHAPCHDEKRQGHSVLTRFVALAADKNQHRLEEADERFKEICNAYEVLSDQHERAWCVPPPLPIANSLSDLHKPLQCRTVHPFPSATSQWLSAGSKEHNSEPHGASASSCSAVHRSMLTITAPCRRRYDSHRDAILRADTHQAGSWGFSGGSARPTDEEDLFSYFSARCYSGYGDDVKVSTAFGMF